MGVRVKDDNGSLKRWESDLAGWEIPRMTRELFYVEVEKAFAETQAFVHIETGSLKGSGKYTTSYNKATHSLEAEITYGGPAPGMKNDPVRFAVYEASRGPEHNPLTPLYALEPSVAAIFSESMVITGALK